MFGRPSALGTRFRVGDVQLVDIESRAPDDLEGVVDAQTYDRFCETLETCAKQMDGRTLWNINSTAEGGGVAELLSALLPYLVGSGWDVRWAVIFGEADFFDVTKDVHNALHGAPPTNGSLTEDGNEIYARTAKANAEQLVRQVRPDDVVFVHDPQTAGLLGPLADAGAHVMWECHVGTDTPNEHTQTAWDFLRPYVTRAERFVFSREAYLWDDLDRDKLRVIPPAIDALSPKNAPLDEEQVVEILANAGVVDMPTTADARRVARTGGELLLPSDARIVLQVSRWDRLKDPIGFIRMFDEHLTDLRDVHLVYAGPSTNGVGDDPEGAEVLAACEETWRSLAPDVQSRVHLLSLPMDDVDENARIVNALQRRANVVVQKSLQEGFGLTVAEAMWKSRPVVATRVGGIQDQIEHGTSGLLVDDPYDIDGFADAVRSVLEDTTCARRLGEAAHDRVHDHFLGPRILTQYAELACELIEAG